MIQRIITSIVLFSISLVSFSIDFSFSHDEGLYNEDIQVEIISEYELYYGFYDAELTRYESALSLSAVRGEARSYELNVYDTAGKKLRSLVYIIDKASPDSPVPSHKPGIYHDQIAISFKNNTDKIFISINGSGFEKYSNEVIIQENTFVSAYSIDSAGNRSVSFSGNYYIDRDGKATDIISPRPGVYGNPQSLVIDAPEVEGISFILNGSSERSYRDPVLLDSNKNNTLKVFSTDAVGNRVLVEEIVYDYDSETEKDTFFEENQLRTVYKSEKLKLPSELYINGFKYSQSELQLPVSTGINEYVVIASNADSINSKTIQNTEFRSVLILNGSSITDDRVKQTNVQARAKSVNQGIDFSVDDKNVFYKLSSQYSESVWTRYVGPVFVRMPVQMHCDFTFEISYNRSAIDSKIQKEIDTRLPGIPRITSNGNALILDGPGTIYYSIDNSDFKVYNASVQLQTISNKRNTFLIRSYSEQGSRQSSIAVTTLVIDLRDPFLPNTNIPTFTNQETLQISDLNLPKELDVYVSWTDDGTEPSNPITSGILHTDFLLQNENNSYKEIHLKLQSKYRYGNKKSTVRSFIVFMDRESPATPVVKNVQDGEIIGNQLQIEFENHPDTIEYTVDDVIIESTQNDLSIPLIKYSGPLTISYWAIDKAGNRSDTHSMAIIVDSEMPPEPSVNIASNQGFWDNTQVIISPASGNDVYYELQKNGVIVATGKYKAPINLQADIEKISKFNLQTFAINSSGNKSEIKNISFYVANPEAVHVTPYVLDLSQYKLLHLNMPNTHSAIVNGQEYTGTMVINDEFVNLQITDNNISWPVYSYKVEDIQIVSMKGLPSKGISAEAAEIHIESEFPVHYEIGKNGDALKEVNLESPQYDENLFLDTLPGTEARYSLSLQLFNKSEAILDSDIVLFFTVDRMAPESPHFVINNLPKSGDFLYYSEPVYLEFSGRGSVFYAIDDSDFELFLDDIYIAPEKGQIKKIIVSAFVQDAAGNKSAIVSTELFLDNEIIYVSNTIGNDSNKGSRDAPLKSIEKALELSISDNRSSIYVSNGQYEINNEIQLAADTAIYGGFNDKWDELSGESRIFINTGKGARFLVEDSITFSCDNIHLSTTSRTPHKGLIEGNGGSLRIESSHIETAGQLAAIHGSFDEVIMYDSSFINKNPSVDYGIFITAKNVHIKDSSLISTKSVSNYTLAGFSSVDNITFENSIFEPGFSDQATAVYISESTLNCIGSKLRLTGAKKNNTGFELNNTVANIKDSQIISLGNSQMAQGIYLANSELTIASSQTQLSGNFGVIGFNLDNSTLLSNDNHFIYTDIPGFCYGFSLRSGEIASNDDVLSFKNVSDAAGVMSDQSQLAFKHLHFSSIDSSNVNGNASGIISSDDKDIFIYASLFETNQKGSFLGFTGIPMEKNIRVQYSELRGWAEIAEGDFKLSDLSDLNKLDNSYSNY